MSIIYIMIPLALVLVVLAVVAMIWAVRTGQFDELESHGWTPVLDDDQRPRSDRSAAQHDDAGAVGVGAMEGGVPTTEAVSGRGMDGGVSTTGAERTGVENGGGDAASEKPPEAPES